MVQTKTDTEVFTEGTPTQNLAKQLPDTKKR